MRKTTTWTSPGHDRPKLTKRRFQLFMLRWYRDHGRDFPWRRSRDPYEILVAEFLLQKTHVRKVPEVYEALLDRCPRVEDLAEVSHLHLLDIIRPLGFGNRARRLIDSAQMICERHRGSIPSEYDLLLTMPGVGPYIATAVCVFAFGQRRVVVDTNVIRVLDVFFDFRSEKPRPRTDRDVWRFADSLAPRSGIREFNWGILDYSAEVLSR
jgi:A/G-specific adenine glycosylase